MTFGVLFDATADTFPALSATLNVAKKRGVVRNLFVITKYFPVITLVL